MPLPSGSAEITSDNQPGLCLTVFSRLDIIWIIRGEHPLTQCFSKRTACSRGANAFNLIKGNRAQRGRGDADSIEGLG